MLKNSIYVLMILLMAVTATAATVGDPVDTNDGISSDSVDTDCAFAELHPACNWCWTNCLFAIIADLWTGGGGWDGDEW